MSTSHFKILLVLIEPPLPFANAASRWFHVLFKELERRNHEVDVVVVSGVDTDIEKAKKTFAHKKNIFIFPFEKNRNFLTKIQTLLYPHRSIFNSEFYQKLDQLNPESYDIIHIEQTWAGWMGFKYSHKTLMNVHFLLSIDLQYAKINNFKEWLLRKSWFRAEKKILARYPHVRTCSTRLENAIRQFGPKQTLCTVPFGLDLSLYPFIPSEKRQRKRPLVTLIGGMTWFPSISAGERLLKNLWPEISKQIPDAELRIVGWSARETFKEYLNTPNVEILENVPNIQPYFEEASVMVYAPARGSGMKIKIQESLAFGIPIVTTSEGAEGLPAQDMVHMGLCDDDAGLIERTVKILKDPELQEKLRQQGRQLVATYCSEEKTVTEIEALYEQILARPK